MGLSSRTSVNHWPAGTTSVAPVDEVPAAARESTFFRIWKYAVPLLVALAVFSAYLPVRHNDFVNFDDIDYIVSNPHIRTLGSDLFHWAFGRFNHSNYIPLTWLSFALNWHFSGSSPLTFHLTNAVLHACNSAMVVLLALELYRYAGIKRENRAAASFSPVSMLLAAALAGLTFGLHPLRVESVAWAAERKDVLSTFFLLPALLAYLSHAGGRMEHPSACKAGSFYHASLLLYVLCCLSKPIVLLFPALLLLLDWYPLRRLDSRPGIREALYEKIPFAAVSAVFLLLTLFAQLATGVSLQHITVKARVLNGFHSIYCYLRNMLWPHNLSPLYPHPWNQVSAASPEYLAPVVLVIAVTLLCIRLAKKGRKVWLAVWGSFLVTLVPVLGFTQVGHQAMADRYTYVPGIMPVILAACLLLRWSLRIPRPGRLALYFAMIMLLLAYGMQTRRMIGIWRDSGTLWSHVIELYPMKAVLAYHHRSYHHLDHGDYERALKDMDACMTVASLIRPDFQHQVHAGRGEILMRMGRFHEALHDFDLAIAACPGPNSEYHLMKSAALLQLGRVDEAAREHGTAGWIKGRSGRNDS